ncbi:MAG: inosine monophosphate cyclohydrolase [Spirochaetes bacterium]|nr:inosine monophosphate cyclohydrolase [Spirochaetota bacterium]
MSILTIAAENFEKLVRNPYPGRGIVLGAAKNGTLAQVYWIMGRSEGSRNRIFTREADGSVKTEAFDTSKMKDADLSLIIYHPVRTFGTKHIVTNGDQTDTIFDAVKQGGTFESALDTRIYEHDKPNYTPRISGITDTADTVHRYKLAIVKTIGNDPEHYVRNEFKFNAPIPGIGHCITTYQGDGNPLPSFDGEPYPLPISDTIDETLDAYWKRLDAANRVSLLVKFIDPKTGTSDMRIVNRNK